MEVSVDAVSSVFRARARRSVNFGIIRVLARHLVRGACSLLNGHVGMMLADNDGEEGWFGNLAVISSVGLPQQVQPLLQRTISQMDTPVGKTFPKASCPG